MVDDTGEQRWRRRGGEEMKGEEEEGGYVALWQWQVTRGH